MTTAQTVCYNAVVMARLEDLYRRIDITGSITRPELEGMLHGKHDSFLSRRALFVESVVDGVLSVGGIALFFGLFYLYVQIGVWLENYQ